MFVGVYICITMSVLLYLNTLVSTLTVNEIGYFQNRNLHSLLEGDIEYDQVRIYLSLHHFGIVVRMSG